MGSKDFLVPLHFHLHSHCPLNLVENLTNFVLISYTPVRPYAGLQLVKIQKDLKALGLFDLSIYF